MTLWHSRLIFFSNWTCQKTHVLLEDVMSLWENRIALAREGWGTQITLDQSGVKASGSMISVRIRASTEIWHGRRFSVSLHLHDTCNMFAAEASLRVDAICEDLRLLCQRAVREFPDCPPLQMAQRDDRGSPKLVPHEMARYIMQQQGPLVHPTEAIPEGKLFSDDDVFVSAILDAARAGLYVEDAIEVRPSRLRGTEEFKNREWLHRIRLAMPVFGGERLNFQPVDRLSCLLHEESEATLVRQSTEAMFNLFSLYAPGGARYGETKNGLPPGFSQRKQAPRKDGFSPGM